MRANTWSKDSVSTRSAGRSSSRPGGDVLPGHGASARIRNGVPSASGSPFGERPQSKRMSMRPGISSPPRRIADYTSTMAPNRQPGPVGQAKQQRETIDNGTLARSRTQPPLTIGAPGSAAPLQTGPVAAATGACAFLNPPAIGTVRAPQEAFDRLRGSSGTATISTPQPRTSYAWPYGAASAALAQDITIDGRTISVTRPTDADAAGKNLPTTAQVAE